MILWREITEPAHQPSPRDALLSLADTVPQLTQADIVAGILSIADRLPAEPVNENPTGLYPPLDALFCLGNGVTP